MKNARTISVIVVTEDDKQSYYTTEGVLIGQQIKKAVKQKKSRGGVVTSPSPKEVKNTKTLETDRVMTLESRLEYEKRNNLS